MDSFCSTDEDPHLSPPVIICFQVVVFNPRDLYYLGYSIIIIMVIWEERSPHPQAMTGKELFCSKEFRC